MSSCHKGTGEYALVPSVGPLSTL
uniref:Uncharacterized protein n=1 Tax=Rhizophora mucronata TaxID=61149 RepID=A0A2P2PQM0_RHIMU